MLKCILDGTPLSEMAMRYNGAVLEYCRTSVSALSGGTAGILGLTGLYGFVFYFLTALVMSVSVLSVVKSFKQSFFLY